jgi:magnesium chelatase family protein
VEAARERQRSRFIQSHSNPQGLNGIEKNILCNADMGPAEVRQFCELDDASRALMRTAMSQLQLSARAYHRVLKLSRTIADLAGVERIGPSHLAEALQYRPRLFRYKCKFCYLLRRSLASIKSAVVKPSVNFS